jgi:multiple sugar transport system ATP-binding protein
MAGIALEHVSKVFADGTAAVFDFDLRVGDGELCVLLGPSGCGKSTVLRLVAGLERVTGGTIRIGDRVVNDVSPQDREIAMVFESSALYPHMNVAENMRFPLKSTGEPAEPQRDRVRRAAGRLGLGEVLGRRPSQLSEGQRRRAAVGRAIVRRPRAFLMDEPLSNVDAQLRVAMRASIGRMHRELGATMLYVTHDQAEAMSLGDRVAVMREGRVEQADEPQVLYDRPGTLFVASFLGSPSMNLWHVRLVEQDGRVAMVSGDQRLRMPDAVLREREGLRARVGGHLILGLRPELFTTTRFRAASTTLELPVAHVDALGSRLLVHLEAHGAGLQLAGAGEALRAGVQEGLQLTGAGAFVRPTETLIASLPPSTRVEVGQRLRLFVDLERAHFFDPATQRALR